MKHRKKISIIFWVVFLVFTIFFVINVEENKQTAYTSSTNTGVTSQPVKVVPLTDIQKQKVEQTILSSEFLQDIPEKNPISIRFFYFEEGQRVWQDTFYMGEGELLSSAQATIKLTLHSKYIDEFNGNNLCSVIQTANQNKDLGFESSYSEANLLWKYKSMLKHRECFGF